MVKKSLLKRASYFGSALILMLAAVPIVPNGKAYAAGATCASDETTLTELLDGTEASFSFCGNIAKTVNITRDVEIDLAGNTLTGKVVVYEGHTVTIKNGVIAGATINDNIVSNKGTLTLENMNITANTYPAVNSNGGTTVISGGAYRSNGTTVLSAKNSGTITVESGDFTGGLYGAVTVNGGKFTANPTNFLGAGKDAYAFDGYWMVDGETTIATTAVNNGKVPVGATVDIFRIATSEYNEMTFTVKRSDDSVHPEDVTLATREEGGETIVSATVNNASTKTIVVENNSGKTATAKLYAYATSGVADQVMFAGTEHAMGITTTKNVTWSLVNSSDTAVAAVSGDTITAVGSGVAEVTVEFNDALHTQQTFSVYVYDFDTTEDTLLVEKGASKNVVTDSNWDVTATATTGESKVQLTDKGDRYKVKGLEAGEAVVTFTTDMDGTLTEPLTKTVKVYVYEVKEKDVNLREGETLNEARIGEIIDKGSDDVVISFKKFGTAGKAENNGLEITGVASGDTKVTYTLAVDGKTASAKFDLHVWNFVTEDLADEYEVGNLAPETGAFRVYDGNGTISYIVRDEAGNDTTTAIVVNQNGNEYTIQMVAGAAPGTYTVTFTDTVAGQEVATKTVTVKVHQIETTGEDEQYIVMTRNPFAASENRYDLNVYEFSGFTRNRDITATVTAASSVGGVSVVYRHGGNWRITANEAGSYEVTFSDGVASKTIKIYVLQFTFGQDSYHVVREEGAAGLLINAINNYWHDVNTGKDTEFVVVNDATGAEVTHGYGVSKTIAPAPEEGEEYGFKWCLSDECLPAGDYTITFRAYANNEQGQATKSVRLHIYEMVAPQEDLYFMETGDDDLYIDVWDLNDRASTRAEITSGPEGGLDFATTGWWIFQQTDYSRLVASAPGVYTVRYTDYMGNGAVVGTYEATVVVIEREHEELFVRRGEKLTLTGNADWDASVATDRTTGVDYVAENGEIEFDTTGMDLGEHIVRIAHDFTEFDDGEFPPREMVKVTAVVVYDVAGDVSDDMTSDADRVSVADFVAGKIAEMVENNSTNDEQVSIWRDIDGLKDLLRSGANIETRLEARLLDEDEWEDAEARGEVLKIVDENGIVAMYEAYLVIYADGNEIGLVYELDDAITMRLEIPEAYRVAADGYTRTFSVVRGHLAMDGTETAEAMDVTRDGDYLVFKNKKFSSFAISYTDNLIPVTPDTGFVASEGGSASASSNLVAAVVTVLGAIALAGAAIFAKRY